MALKNIQVLAMPRDIGLEINDVKLLLRARVYNTANSSPKFPRILRHSLLFQISCFEL